MHNTLSDYEFQGQNCPGERDRAFTALSTTSSKLNLIINHLAFQPFPQKRLF